MSGSRMILGVATTMPNPLKVSYSCCRHQSSLGGWLAGEMGVRVQAGQEEPAAKRCMQAPDSFVQQGEEGKDGS